MSLIMPPNGTPVRASGSSGGGPDDFEAVGRWIRFRCLCFAFVTSEIFTQINPKGEGTYINLQGFIL